MSLITFLFLLYLTFDRQISCLSVGSVFSITENNSLSVPNTWPDIRTKIRNPSNRNAYLTFRSYGRAADSRQKQAIGRRLESLNAGDRWRGKTLGFGFDTTAYKESVEFKLVDHFKDRHTLDDATIHGILSKLDELIAKHGLIGFVCESWLIVSAPAATRTATISMIVRRPPPNNHGLARPVELSLSNSTLGNPYVRCTFRIPNPQMHNSRLCLFNVVEWNKRHGLDVDETKYFEGATIRRLWSFISEIGTYSKVRPVTASEIFYNDDEARFALTLKHEEGQILTPHGAIGVLTVMQSLITSLGLMTYDAIIYVNEKVAATARVAIIRHGSLYQVATSAKRY